jgi:hypothetical protein
VDRGTRLVKPFRSETRSKKDPRAHMARNCTRTSDILSPLIIFFKNKCVIAEDDIPVRVQGGILTDSCGQR